MLTIHEGVFELFVVKDEYATEAQVAAALKEQRKLKKSGKKVRLDELMVEMGHLRATEAEDIREKLDDEIIPGYRLHEELGRGGMGTVYRATQLSMERDVAVKVLSRRLSKDKKFCKKFLQEARNAAKLNHENIMGGIDCGEENGLHFFVMEYVDGESLADQIDRNGPLTVDRAFQVLEQVSRGLKHAHGQKIVHRDIKPENIMLTTDNVVKICDLGLAKPEIKAGEGVKGGTCEGTPYYCAPEQALGRTDIDVKADIYALGASIFHLLTNKTPFDGESARAILWQQVNTPFPDWKEAVPSLSSDQRRLLEDMVIKNREKRLESVDALIARLQAIRASDSIAKGPSRRLSTLSPNKSDGLPLPALVGGGVVILALVAWLAMGPGKEAGDPISQVTQEGPPRVVKKTRPVKLIPVKGPRVDRPKDPKPAPTFTDETSKEMRQAKRLLQDAEDFEAANPDDAKTALVRFRDVVERFPKTPPALTAARQVRRLMGKARRALGETWKGIVKQTRVEMTGGQYRKAIGLIESFKEGYDAIILEGFEKKIERQREAITQAAGRELDAIAIDLGNWAKAAQSLEAHDFGVLDEFKARCPDSLHAKIESIRGEALVVAKAKVASENVRVVLEAIRNHLVEGDLDAALAALSAAQNNPELAGNKAEIDAKANELKHVTAAWHSLEKAFKDLVGQTQVFPFKNGKEQRATVKDFDPKRLEIRLKYYGRKEEIKVHISELGTEFLAGLLPQPRDLSSALGNMNYCILRGLVEEALHCLTAAKSIGIADKSMEARIQKALVEMKEKVVQRLIEQLSSTPIGEQMLALIRRITTDLSGTEYYKVHRQVVIDHFTESRARQIIEEDPEALFNCKVQRISTKTLKYRLSYDFKTQKQIADFIGEVKTLKGSSTKFQDKKAIMTGRIRHKARFAGGPLKFEMKCVPADRKKPNINLMISDQGGLNGVFVGLGTRMRSKEIMISDKAAKKKGARISLPANIVADARDKNWAYMFGDKKPTLKGNGVVRYYLERTKRGTLIVKVGTRIYINLKDAPRSDEAGSIGFYLQGVKLEVQEMKIEGIFEEKWIVDSAMAVATKEAEGFPGAAAKNPKKNKKK
jgi:eukaryotic-like serine/threonine-protein kinase